MCVAPDSQHYLTINTNKSLFTFNRKPFGICSTPGILQQTMDNLLSGIPGVICYLDDILVVGKNEEQHEQRLLTVLRRLDKTGMRLKHEKWEFNQPQVQYLGHIISEQGISPSETKVQAIRDAPVPTNVTELKAFLGLLDYYGRFLPNLSATLHSLYALLGNNRPWKWGSKERDAFQKGKQKLLGESKFLTRYDLQRPVSLSCNASPYGVSACLTHVMPDGEERPIAFASRTLSTTEKKYVQLEKEALALVYEVKQFYKYLVGREFTLFTDHRPLLKILGRYEGVPTLAVTRLQRRALLLSAYNYKLEFKSGVDNKEADLLTRFPIPMQVLDSNEEIYHVDYCDQLPVTATEIARET